MNIARYGRLFTILALAAGVAHAHHGWSEYDGSKPLKVAGVIKEFGYEHPHGHVRLQAGDKTWLVVLAPPSRMTSRGLAAADLKPGTRRTYASWDRDVNTPAGVKAHAAASLVIWAGVISCGRLLAYV